jgi:hypothetical protein
MFLYFLYLINFYSDILRLQFGQRTVFVVEKQSTKELFVMKMINIRQEGTENPKKNNGENQHGVESWTTVPLR